MDTTQNAPTSSTQKKASVITFANQKGGVGKSTSVVNIAASLGLLGKRVLVVDSDPQGNTTSGFGVNKRTTQHTIYDVLIGRADVQSATIETKFQNIHLLPANISLAGAEFELVLADDREARLKDALEKVKDRYDIILIDCPPSLGILTINALVAANGLVIPMQCEYYSLEGLSQLMMSVKQIKKRFNPDLNLTGILITMYNNRLILSAQVLSELRKHYADKLFETTVSRNVKLSEAPSFGLPVYYHEKRSKGAVEYLNIAKELAERI